MPVGQISDVDNFACIIKVKVSCVCAINNNKNLYLSKTQLLDIGGRERERELSLPDSWRGVDKMSHCESALLEWASCVC